MNRRRALHEIGLPPDAPDDLVTAALREYARQVKGRLLAATTDAERERLVVVRKRLREVREAISAREPARARSA